MAIDIEAPGANEAALSTALKDLVGRPTRTTATLSGSSTDVSIPAGCTWFKFQSKTITMTTSSAGCSATLRHTGNTVSQAWSGFDTFSGAVAGGGSFVFSVPTAASRRVEGEVYGPRDASAPTMASGFGHGASTSWRKSFSDSSEDHDTMRFEASAGTFSGDVLFMWFYN